MVKHRLSNINPEQRTAICLACGPVKVYPKYMKATPWRCATRTNQHIAKYHRKGRRLGKACEICGANSFLCWDHSHVSGAFRGTLCRTCNLAIGLLKDNPALCLQAAKYLK